MSGRESSAKSSISRSSLKARGNVNVSSSTVNHYGDQISSAPDPVALLREHVAFGALHDSKSRFDPPKCHPETRTAILESIDSWARNSFPGVPPMIWLSGAAGAGKSAIAQTSMERWTNDKLIAVSFFFWRTDSERNQKSRLIPTLAYQLRKILPGAKPKFRDAIGDGDIFLRTLQSQVKTLVVHPLKGLLAKTSNTVIIVVDGLDECCVNLPKVNGFPGQGHESQQAEILEALAFACQHVPSLRVLITSRPEHRIRLSFKSKSFAGGFLKDRTIPLSLNKVDADHDILLFLECRFVEIRAEYHGIPTSWPSSEQLSQLVRNSSGCFIYPSVVVRYVLHRGKAPLESLEIILDLRPNTMTNNHQDNPFAELDALYRYILKSVPVHSIGTARDILGYICFEEAKPFVQKFREGGYSQRTFFSDSIHQQSPLFFQELLFLTPGDIFNHLNHLHAILDIPDSEGPEKSHQKIKFLHVTFSQYLLDESRSGEFFINMKEFERRLLKLLEIHIQRIVQLSEADTINTEVSKPDKTPHFRNLVNSFINLNYHISKSRDA